MAMEPTKAETSSKSRSRWDGRVVQCHGDRLEVLVNGRVLPSVQCPPADSLERRHAASDQSWLKAWLDDDADPTQP